MFLFGNKIIGKELLKICTVLYAGKHSRLEKQIKFKKSEWIEKLTTKWGSGSPKPFDSLIIKIIVAKGISGNISSLKVAERSFHWSNTS